VLGIVAVAVVFVGIIIGGVIWIAQLATDAVRDAAPGILGPESVSSDDPGTPVAKAPDNCPDDCFTAIIGDDLVIPSASLDAVGLTEVYAELGYYGASTPATEHRQNTKYWSDAGNSPDSCFFTMLISPVTYPLDEAPEFNFEPVHFLGTHTDADELNTLDQALRVFETSDAAQEHLASLESAVAGCESLTYGEGVDAAVATVTPIAAVTLPDSVAAYGWVEEYAYVRHYVIDLQRSNIVTRTSVWADTEISEKEFRSLVESVAAKLGSLEP
jgi:hypothetical protein